MWGLGIKGLSHQSGLCKGVCPAPALPDAHLPNNLHTDHCAPGLYKESKAQEDSVRAEADRRMGKAGAEVLSLDPSIKQN